MAETEQLKEVIPAAAPSEQSEQGVVQLLASLAQPAPTEGFVASTALNSVMDPPAGMEPSSAATEPEVPLVEQPAEEEQQPVEVPEMLFYARLEQAPFPEDGTGVAFLLDKPYCVIGRRTTLEDPVQVSIDSTKVSRRHARIQYNYNKGEFEVAVWGRNGCWVEYPEWFEGGPEPDKKLFTEGTENPKPVPLTHEWVFYLLLTSSVRSLTQLSLPAA
jgi:hypothetical protein